MTHFEYVAAAHTLILTFAAARILAGISYVLTRRRLYWVHASWTSLAIMFALTSFWVFWAYRDVEWTLERLILLLGAPALIYVFSAIVVPANAAEVESWREYFFENRRRLFVVGAALIVAIVLSNQLLVGVSASSTSQLPLYGLFTAFCVGAIWDDARLHVALALLPPMFFVGILAVLSQTEGLNA